MLGRFLIWGQIISLLCFVIFVFLAAFWEDILSVAGISGADTEGMIASTEEEFTKTTDWGELNSPVETAGETVQQLKGIGSVQEIDPLLKEESVKCDEAATPYQVTLFIAFAAGGLLECRPFKRVLPMF